VSENSRKFLRKQEVADRYGVTKRTVDNMVQDGRLDPPIYRSDLPTWDSQRLDKADDALVRAAIRKQTGRPAKA
jgi:hypothetical protein